MKNCSDVFTAERETMHAIGGGPGVLVDVATEKRLVCNY